jgi:hypothetical protein
MGTGKTLRRLGIPTFVLVLTAAAAAQSCQTANGLYLATSGGRLGDPWFVGVNGNPGVSGYLGIDVAAGPSPTPIGPVCLGLTPNLQLVPFALPGSGSFSIGGVVPTTPALTGLTAFLQAAAVDPSQPGGYAVSNGSMVTLRPPRAFITYWGGGGDGTYCVYDGLTDTLKGPFTVPGMTLKAVMIPSLSWVAFLTSEGWSSYHVLRCYDANTGASTLTQTIPAGGAGVAKLAVEGTTLYVLERGWFLGASMPGRLHSFSLPSCTLGFACALPPACDPDDLMILPGQGIAYVQLGTTVVPVNLVTGTLLPTVDFGIAAQGPVNAPFNGISEWVRVGTVVYCLFQGIVPGFFSTGLTLSSPYLGSIDTLTHTALPSSPFPINPPYGVASLLRYGPGTNGNALFVWAGNPLMLRQLDPATFAVTGSTSVPGNGIVDMALSSGGTEWLVVASNPPSLHVMNPQTLAVTMVTPTPVYTLAVLPNATAHRAFMIGGDSTRILPIQTDPVIAPASGIPLPFPWVSQILID